MALLQDDFKIWKNELLSEICFLTVPKFFLLNILYQCSLLR